jgi:DNA-binding response OmpR family regulator
MLLAAWSATLYVPLTKIAARQDDAPLGPRHVLIVEDNPLSRDALRFLLERQGHQVDVAATGPEGLEAGVSRPPDVAVIDLGLPIWDGFRVARGLRAAAGTSITLIAYTADDEYAKRAEAEAAGFDAYLVKPSDLRDLLHWFDPDPCAGG